MTLFRRMANKPKQKKKYWCFYRAWKSWNIILTLFRVSERQPHFQKVHFSNKKKKHTKTIFIRHPENWKKHLFHPLGSEFTKYHVTFFITFKWKSFPPFFPPLLFDLFSFFAQFAANSLFSMEWKNSPLKGRKIWKHAFSHSLFITSSWILNNKKIVQRNKHRQKRRFTIESNDEVSSDNLFRNLRLHRAIQISTFFQYLFFNLVWWYFMKKLSSR